MIAEFEEYTEPLTDYERDVLAPVLTKALARRIGKHNAISNKDICRAMLERDYQVSDARIRKVINHIRNNDLVLGLIANSKGYYVAEKEEELRTFIDGLESRAQAISQVARSMQRHLRKLYEVEAPMKLFDDEEIGNV